MTCLYNQDKRANLARFIFYKIYISRQIIGLITITFMNSAKLLSAKVITEQ